MDVFCNPRGTNLLSRSFREPPWCHLLDAISAWPIDQLSGVLSPAPAIFYTFGPHTGSIFAPLLTTISSDPDLQQHMQKHTTSDVDSFSLFPSSFSSKGRGEGTKRLNFFILTVAENVARTCKPFPEKKSFPIPLSICLQRGKSKVCDSSWPTT